MIFLDFLIFYLTAFFEERKEKLSWSTPLERAIYVLGITTIFWLFVLDEIISFFLLKTALITTPLIFGVIVGLAVMQAYTYIYIKKDRYSFLNLSMPKRFAFKKGAGQTLSIIFVFFSCVLPYLIFMVFT